MEADALATAAHDKNQQAIQRLQQRIHILDEAQQRQHVNGRDFGGRTALHYAALNDDSALLSWLLAHHADVTLQDGQGQTPLHLALKDRHKSAAQTLLKQPGIRVDVLDQFNRLPLHWAAQAGYADLLPLCLTPAVSVNSATQGGDTPLHWAVTERHVAVVRSLLQHSEEVSVTLANQRGDTAASLAKAAGGEIEQLVTEREQQQKRLQQQQQRQSESDAPMSTFAVSSSAPPADGGGGAGGAKKKMTIKLKPKK